MLLRSSLARGPTGLLHGLGISRADVHPAVKNQRLDYELLVESLKDRNLVDPEALSHILHQCESTGALLPALLVSEGLVSDWELARITCDVFGLPFLPLESYEPKRELADQLDANFLRQYLIVPLDRFGGLMTVAMPGMVPGVVLTAIEKKLDVKVLPIVGSVQGNMRWIEEHLPPPETLQITEEEARDGDWTDVLDLGDQAVKSIIEPGKRVISEADEELASSLQMFDLADDELGGGESSTNLDVSDIELLAKDLESQLAEWKVPDDELGAA